MTQHNENTKPQSVEEFLTAGGKIQQCKPGESANVDPKKIYNPGPPLIFDPEKRERHRRPNF